MAAQYKARTATRSAAPSYNRGMPRLRAAGRTSPTLMILVAACAAAFGLWLGTGFFGRPARPRLSAAVLYPVPRTVPDFSLVRSDGKTLDAADWSGRWTVAYFGYTNCPDVCPTTLAAFKQAWKRLDAATSAKWRFDFISVDQARDTPAQLARYVGFFDPAFVAATGRDEQLTRLTRALGLVYSRDSADDGNYAVDHSAAVVIIDPRGREIGLFRPPFEADKIAADLATLAGNP